MKTVLSWFVAVGVVVAGVCAGANVSAPGGDPSVREALALAQSAAGTAAAASAALVVETNRAQGIEAGISNLAQSASTLAAWSTNWIATNDLAELVGSNTAYAVSVSNIAQSAKGNADFSTNWIATQVFSSAATDWSQHPATQHVEMAGFHLNTVGMLNMEQSGNIIFDDPLEYRSLGWDGWVYAFSGNWYGPGLTLNGGLLEGEGSMPLGVITNFHLYGWHGGRFAGDGAGLTNLNAVTNITVNGVTGTVANGIAAVIIPTVPDGVITNGGTAVLSRLAVDGTNTVAYKATVYGNMYAATSTSLRVVTDRIQGSDQWKNLNVCGTWLFAEGSLRSEQGVYSLQFYTGNGTSTNPPICNRGTRDSGMTPGTLTDPRTVYLISSNQAVISILPERYVGVNTTNPVSALDVRGIVSVDGTNYVRTTITVTTPDGPTNVTFLGFTSAP